MMESQESSEHLKETKNDDENYNDLLSSLEDLNSMLSSGHTTSVDDGHDDDPELAAVEAAIETQEQENENSANAKDIDGDLMASLTLALEDDDEDEDDKMAVATSTQNSATDNHAEQGEILLSEPSTSAEFIPLQQFLNAMTIIQDLESRVAILEDERATLLEETQLQKMMIGAYEKKLSAFPKMMEELIAENDKIVAKVASESAKITYWNQHMRKEEAKHAMEQKIRTDTLQQSDFLADIVARKEVESRHQRNSLWKRISSVSLSSAGGSGAGADRGRKTSSTSSTMSFGRTSSRSTGSVNIGRPTPATATVTKLTNGIADRFTIDDDDDDDHENVELAQNASADSGVLDLIS